MRGREKQMRLSPLAKHCNSPEKYKQLQKLVDTHNKAYGNNADIKDVDISINADELDKAIQTAIDKTMKQYFK